jgi:hypothetical protein
MMKKMPPILIRALTLTLFLYMPVAHAAEECPPARQIRANLESWKNEVSKKGITQSRLGELFAQMHLKTGFARELPDIEQAGILSRTIEISGVDDLKAKLSGRATPEHVIVTKYQLKVARSCGEHENGCFEGYGIQVLRPLAKGLWCSYGNDLSAEIWGPDRDFKFCPEAKGETRDFGFFALTRNGRKAIQVDDFRAHCPSTGTRTSNHERSFWEIQEGSLARIFQVTLHSQSGGPDFGKKTSVKGHLTFSGNFPKLITFEAQDELCGAEAFSDDPVKAKNACNKRDRIEVYSYSGGHYRIETPIK